MYSRGAHEGKGEIERGKGRDRVRELEEVEEYGVSDESLVDIEPKRRKENKNSDEKGEKGQEEREKEEQKRGN